MSASPRHEGLLAATFTPLDEQGRLNLAVVPDYVDALMAAGVSGLYVCGSTGEGPSLTGDERRRVAEAFVRAASGRVPVLVQVGHNSLWEARELAQHAAAIGADAVSATCPSYFKVHDPRVLADCMAEIAAGAPDLPFYYYHIPALTGSAIDLVEWLPVASERIGNLVGIKYTDTRLHEYQGCQSWQNQQMDVLWGCDEMLLGALSVGARAAIGSTYNFMAPVYHNLIAAYQAGDLAEARSLQLLTIRVIACLMKYTFQTAAKRLMAELGVPLGGCRLPLVPFKDANWEALNRELTELGFYAAIGRG